jgi:hypothetical protein
MRRRSRSRVLAESHIRLRACDLTGESRVDDRLKDFFDSGTVLAWVIDPDKRRAEICRSLSQRTLMGTDGFLKGEDVLPGFRYPIADLFKKWAWE